MYTCFWVPSSTHLQGTFQHWLVSCPSRCRIHSYCPKCYKVETTAISLRACESDSLTKPMTGVGRAKGPRNVPTRLTENVISRRYMNHLTPMLAFDIATIARKRERSRCDLEHASEYRPRSLRIREHREVTKPVLSQVLDQLKEIQAPTYLKTDRPLCSHHSRENNPPSAPQVPAEHSPATRPSTLLNFSRAVTSFASKAAP